MAYKPPFHVDSPITGNFFYAYSAIVGSFVIVSFFLRKITFRSTAVHKQAKIVILSKCFGQDDCYFRCDITVYLQLYQYTTFVDTAKLRTS